MFAATEVFNSHTVIRYLGGIDCFTTSIVHTLHVSINNIGSRKLEGVVLNKSNFASFVRNLLLIKQYRVEIFKSNGKLASDWSLEYKVHDNNVPVFSHVSTLWVC